MPAHARLTTLAAALSLALPSLADDLPTPRAGEAVTRTVLGVPVSAPARDRSRITYLSAGAAPVLDGPEGTTFGPQGGLYLWRAGKDRLRAVVAGISNEVRWDRALATGTGLSAVVTFDSTTLPWDRSEYVDGVRLAAGELRWSQLRAGFGLAWRQPLAPWQCDNGLDVAATFEFGDLWFRRGEDTAPSYVVPVDTFEARAHLRVRADALQRNLLELPHRGWSAGLDAVYGRRSHWEPWGLPAAGLEPGALSWAAFSGFVTTAFRPFPGLSERHRLVASAHGGIGRDLDRFSAFRLGGGSTWGDFETLSRVVLPGAGVDELTTSRYATLDLEYRLELLFFLFLQLRGTLAWAELPGASPGAGVSGESFRAVTAGFTTGLPWGLATELAVARNFDLVLVRDGRAEAGRTSLVLNVTKEF